ncbi:MAG TPA: YbaK/EbsC family protein [Candidatus Binatia bacterium]|jgi:Ala-tRNA(Pro) deacylase
MPILGKLKKTLDEAKISYEIYNHRLSFTAQETAQSLRHSGKKMAKVVILKANGSYAMAVVPGNRMVSLRKARLALAARDVSVAGEKEFDALFPGCEIGAMPPFGNLFGLPVYVDPALETEEEIFFNAGNHQQTVRMSYGDFRKLVNPMIISLTESRYRKAA